MQIIKQNIDVLVREGLGERGEQDLLLVREVCVALNKLTSGKKVREHHAVLLLELDNNHVSVC